MIDWVARISYSPKTQKQETKKIDELVFSFDLHCAWKSEEYDKCRNVFSVSTVETETSLVPDFEMRAFSRIRLQI